MGATLSACSAAGCGKRCADQLGWIRSDADEQPCSFSAEVYKLSADHRHWLKVYPEVLSLRVLPAAVGNNQHQQQQHMPGIAASGGVALLEAVGLVDGRRAALGKEEEGTTDRQGKRSASADDEDGMLKRAALFTLPISEEAELKRYTEKFVYWRDPSPEAPVFGLNILSAAEADRFCAALRHLPPTPFLVPKWHRDEIVFEAHMAPLMAVHRGRLEECPTPLFTRCRVMLHERDATIGLTDELGHHVLARTSTTECIFCLCPSPSSAMGGCGGGVQLQPHRHDHPQLLFVSFPDRALLLQLPTRAQQLALCRHALRASAAAMAGALAVGGAAGDDTARVARLLRARLVTLGRVMRKLQNANDQTNGLIRVPDCVEQEPVLLCNCEPAVAMRRRRAMFALLKYAMSTRICALCDDAANEGANGGNNCSSELEKMLSSSHHFFPSAHNANAIHVAHRVHLRAVLSCHRFSLQRTVQLLAKWSQNDDEWRKDGEEEEAEESGGGMEAEEEEEEVQGTEEQQRRPHAESEFSQIELNPRPRPLPSAGGSTPAQQLVHVLLELVESEQVFVHDMQTLLSLFVLPSRLSSLQCVRELCRTHRQFLGSLQTALGPSLWPPPSSAPSPEEANSKLNRQMGAVLSRVGALFIAKSAQFKVYSKYTFGHSHFQRNREADADFNCLMVALSASLGGTHALNSLLIKPVQRLCKYPLFLEQLHALCPPAAALGSKTPAAECASICLKALRQMRILANWLNEMVRIQEDYGAELALSSASTTTNGATTIECGAHVALPSVRNALISRDMQQSMNGLNSLLLFSHVRWTNPPASSSAAADDDDDQRQQLSGAAAAAAASSCPSLNCVLFVFSTSIVVLERKRPNQQQLNNRSSSSSSKRLAPIVLPIARVLLSLIATSSSPSGAACSSTSSSSSFVLAILPNPSSVPNTSSAPSAAHFLRFECFHPAVCRHLAQLLQHRTATAMAADGAEHPSMNNRMVGAKYEGQQL